MGLRGTAWALSCAPYVDIHTPPPPYMHTHTHTICRETQSDFLLLRPIKATVSPKPDERLTQMRTYLQRFRNQPRGSGLAVVFSLVRIWPKPRLQFVFTEVTIVQGPVLQQGFTVAGTFSKELLAFRCDLQGNVI